jgi:hypothetical protein
MKPSRASRVLAVIACVAAPFVLTALYLDFSASFLNYFDIGVAGGARFFFPLFFECPIVFILLLLAGLSVFIVLRKRSRGSWSSFAFALAMMLVVFASAAAFEVYRFRDYPDYERYPAVVRDGVPGFLKWYVTSFKFPWRPNQALERTADRRENLLAMTSTLKLEALLALVSGRSALSR